MEFSWSASAVVAIVLAIATVASLFAEHALWEKQKKRAHFDGAPPPDPAPALSPFIAAATLIAIAVYLVGHNAIDRTVQRTDPVAISNCPNGTGRLAAPKEAAKDEISAIKLESNCKALLTSASLQSGSDAATTAKVVRIGDSGEGDYAMWLFSAKTGPQRFWLAANPSRSTAASGSIEVKDKPAASMRTDNGPRTGCNVGLRYPMEVRNNAAFAVDVSTPCAYASGKIIVDGAEPTPVAVIRGLDGGRHDQYILKASAGSGVQRIDAVYTIANDAVMGPVTVAGKAPVGFSDVSVFATTAFGALAAIGGLITAVLAIFKAQAQR